MSKVGWAQYAKTAELHDKITAQLADMQERRNKITAQLKRQGYKFYEGVYAKIKVRSDIKEAGKINDTISETSNDVATAMNRLNAGAVKTVINYLYTNKDAITKLRRVMLYRKDGTLVTCGLDDFMECAISSQGDLVIMIRERGFVLPQPEILEVCGDRVITMT